MFKKIFSFFLFFFFVFSAWSNVKQFNFLYNNQNPFKKLKHFFYNGNTNFSFDLKNINWYSGRCFSPQSSTPLSSLLFLLPNDFYKKESNAGPLFPESESMWILGSTYGGSNEFDTMTAKKEERITKLLKSSETPKIKRYNSAFVSILKKKARGMALRKYNQYLIVERFYLYSNLVSEYCYYFKKVK